MVRHSRILVAFLANLGHKVLLQAAAANDSGLHSLDREAFHSIVTAADAVHDAHRCRSIAFAHAAERSTPWLHSLGLVHPNSQVVAHSFYAFRRRALHCCCCRCSQDNLHHRDADAPNPSSNSYVRR